MPPKRKQRGGQVKGKSKPIGRKCAAPAQEPESENEEELAAAAAHVDRRTTISNEDPRDVSPVDHSSSSEESADTQDTQAAQAGEEPPRKRKKKTTPFPFNAKQTDAMIDW